MQQDPAFGSMLQDRLTRVFAPALGIAAASALSLICPVYPISLMKNIVISIKEEICHTWELYGPYYF